MRFPQSIGVYHRREQPLGFILAPAWQLGHTHILGVRNLARACTHWAGRSVCAHTAPQAIGAFAHLENVYHCYFRCGTVGQQQTKFSFYRLNAALLASLSIRLLWHRHSIIWLGLWLGVHAAPAAVHIFIALAMISFLLHFVRGTPERR
jgi:hypothetical protein